MFLHFFRMIQIVKFVSSRQLLEHRAGIAGKLEETVLIIHKNLVMLQLADHRDLCEGKRSSFCSTVTQT